MRRAQHLISSMNYALCSAQRSLFAHVDYARMGINRKAVEMLSKYENNLCMSM